MFAREKLRGNFLASILAENGNRRATKYFSHLWSKQDIAGTYLSHVLLPASRAPPSPLTTGMTSEDTH